MSFAEFLSQTCQRHVSVVFVIEFLKIKSLESQTGGAMLLSKCQDMLDKSVWIHFLFSQQQPGFLFILLSIEFDSAIAFIIKSVCRERRSEEEYTSKTFTWRITLTFESN